MKIIGLLVLSSILFASVSATPYISASDVLPWNWSIFQRWWSNVATAHVKPPNAPGSGTSDVPIPTSIKGAETKGSGAQLPGLPVGGNPIKLSVEVAPNKLLEGLVPNRVKRAETDLIYEYDGYA